MSNPRIIAGTAKNRVLEVPKSGTRPSPSRLREALFSILAFEQKGTFLDLFSGSGAVGLEAASRGWNAICVDKSKGAANVLRRNVNTLKLPAEVIMADALQYIKTCPKADICFAAPPYTLELPPIFDAIIASDVAPYLILQHPKELTLVVPSFGMDVDTRVYGVNALTLLKKNTQ